MNIQYAPLQVFEMVRERLCCPGFFEPAGSRYAWTRASIDMHGLALISLFVDLRFYW